MIPLLKLLPPSAKQKTDPRTVFGVVGLFFEINL